MFATAGAATVRWKPYPAYKPSGVEWLGDVPAHWDVRRLKHVSRFAYGDSLASDNREDGDVPVYGSNGQVGTHTLANTLAPVLIVGRKGSFGKVNFSNQAVFAIDTTYFIDARSSKADLRWLFYALPLLNLDQVSQDSAIPGLSRETAYASVLPVPTPNEQLAIAAFLDRETAKLDTLIAKHERLIELLQEKRAALISHAVTQGLDPSAPMKDSGVPWLGQIPAHWQTLLLKRTANIRYGLGQPPPEMIEGAPLIRATNIKSGHIFDEGMIYVDPAEVPAGRNAVLSEGEIIVVRSGAYTGDSTIIPAKYSGAISGYDLVVTIREGYSPFFAWQFLCPAVRDLQFIPSSLRAAQPHLNAEELGATIIAVPPLPEQCAIAAYLDHETAKLDALMARVRQGIEKLGEYRAALISAAVTGKMDVRQSS